MKILTRITFIALLTLALSLVTSARADEELNLDFDLVNKTGWGIKEVYVSPSASDDWEENILKAPLKDGETLEVTFHPKLSAKKWDLKIVWVDGGDAVFWRGCDLSEISKLSLFYDEDKDETSAKAE